MQITRNQYQNCVMASQADSNNPEISEQEEIWLCLNCAPRVTCSMAYLGSSSKIEHEWWWCRLFGSALTQSMHIKASPVIALYLVRMLNTSLQDPVHPRSQNAVLRKCFCYTEAGQIPMKVHHCTKNTRPACRGETCPLACIQRKAWK